LTCLWLLLAAYTAGTALLGRLRLDGWRRKVTFRTAAGLGLLAYAVLGIGLLGGLRPWVGWLLTVAAIAAGLPALGREARYLRRWRDKTAATPVTFERREIFPHLWPGGGWPRAARWAVLAVAALATAVGLLVALAPPAGYDELTYHLAAPKVFVRTGTVSILPYDHHTAFSFTMEMLYTLALLVGNAATAKLLHVACWLGSLLALFGLGRDYLGQRSGWMAVAIYAATPLAMTHVGLAYTEFGLTLFELLAVTAFLEYLNLRATAISNGAAKARQPQWLPLVGAMVGLCYGVKATAGLLGAYLVAAILVLGRRDGLTPRARRADALLVTAVAAAVALPWPARAWWVTGNPLFPFADGVFHSRLWSADRAAPYDAEQKRFGQAVDERTLAPTEPYEAHRRWPRLATVAWNATFHPTWFFDTGLNFDGKARLGPAYLAAGLPLVVLWPLLAWRRRRGLWRPGYVERRTEESETVFSPQFGRDIEVARTRAITEEITVDTARVVGLLLGFVLCHGLFWFRTMQYLRYLAPTLALAAVLAGWVFDGLLRLRLAAVATLLVLAIHVAGGAAYAVVGGWAPLRVALGGLSPETYAAAALPAYDAMMWLNKRRPEGAVMLYGEPRGYWLDGPYLWGERNHSTIISDAARQSLDSYLAALRGLGVSHVLVFEAAFPLGRAEGHDDVALVSQAVAAGRLALVWADPNPRHRTVVYEVH
jgi:4-amino-4-deoxy-L-arabinose transferase-like glycosyltransferase